MYGAKASGRQGAAWHGAARPDARSPGRQTHPVRSLSVLGLRLSYRARSARLSVAGCQCGQCAVTLGVMYLTDAEALGYLRWHWGEAFEVGRAGHRWSAVRRDNGHVLTADDADELLAMIRREPPVPRAEVEPEPGAPKAHRHLRQVGKIGKS